MSKDLIVKSYNIVEARYKLTPAEAKLIAILAANIEKDDTDFNIHRFNITYLLEATGIGADNHDDLKKMIKNLMRKILEIQEETKFIQVAFLSSVTYHEHKGLVDLKFDSVLKPYLLDLKERFIKYKIDSVLSLRSFYSIRFYELLVKWEKIGSFKMTLKEIRNMFQIKDNEYPKYSNIKQKIILTAQTELKEKADLYFDFKEIKESRKIIELEFRVKRKKSVETKKQSVSINAGDHTERDYIPSSKNADFERIKILADEENIIKQLQEELIAIHDNKTDKMINKLKSEELITEFLDHMKILDKGLVLELYKRQGIEHFLVKVELRKYISRKYLKLEDYDIIAYAKSKGYELEENKSGKYKLKSEKQF